MILAWASLVVAAASSVPKNEIHSSLLEAIQRVAAAQKSSNSLTEKERAFSGGTSSQIRASMPSRVINCFTSPRKTESIEGGWQRVNRQESLTGESINSISTT